MGCHSLNEEGEEKRIFCVALLMSFQCILYIFLLPLFPVPRGFLYPAHLYGWWGQCCSSAPWPPCWSPKGSLTTFWLHKPFPDQRHQPSPYFQYLSSHSSPYLWLYKKWFFQSLLSLPLSNPSAQTLSYASSPHSSIPPCAVPTPEIPSFSLLSAHDSCHLGPIRSDWSSILQHQVHLICEALQLGL